MRSASSRMRLLSLMGVYVKRQNNIESRELKTAFIFDERNIFAIKEECFDNMKNIREYKCENGQI